MLFLKYLKDFLVGTFGVVGFGLWFIIGALTMFAPLVFLDVSFWVSLLIIIAILYIPIIGDITNLVIWIWSFVVVISEPIDGFSIAYFIIFAIYGLSTIIPPVIGVFMSVIGIFTNKSNNFNECD